MDKPSRSANGEGIIFVDPQLDFMPGGALAVAEGDQIIETLNLWVTYANHYKVPLVVTRDWHPEDTVHFDRWPPHCIQHSPGARFHPDIQLDNATVFSKGMGKFDDSYSGFDGVTAVKSGGVDLRWQIGLDEWLQYQGITKLMIMGLATDYCVLYTVKAALKHGYQVVVDLNGCRAVNLEPSDGLRAIMEMKNLGASTIP